MRRSNNGAAQERIAGSTPSEGSKHVGEDRKKRDRAYGARRRPRKSPGAVFVVLALPVLATYASLSAIASRVRGRGRVGVAPVVCTLLLAGAAADFLASSGIPGVTLASPDRALAEQGGEEKTAASPEERAAAGEDMKAAAPDEKASGSEEMKVLGEYKTDFLWDSNPNRQANMRLAAGAINNTVLEPGEVFSFNELTSDLDYEAAKTFSDGGVGYANGGGLCQVSSTLYMAVQYAGLEIVERNAHYAVLPYIRPGFDATVWFGGDGIPELDMRFKNTTGGEILVREWVDEKGFLNARILGEKPTGLEVEMRSEKVFEDPNRGIKWATYKKVTNEDGEVLFDGLLHQDIYSYNPPVPAGVPHYETRKPRVAGWPDPSNTTGWADVR